VTKEQGISESGYKWIRQMTPEHSAMSSETDAQECHCNDAWSAAGSCQMAKGSGDQLRSRTAGQILPVDSGGTMV
jgi:hypothetical protein